MWLGQRNEFGTQPTQVTITRLCDKSETDGTMQNVKKDQSGRPCSSADNESFVTMLQAFT
jgi:hypothetical protein